MRILGVDIQTELIIGLSLSVSDVATIKKKGLDFFKKKLYDYLEAGKPTQLPNFFVVRALQFARLTKEFEQNSEEIKFLVESSSQVLKEPIFRNLAMINNPSMRIPESKAIPNWATIMGEVKPSLSELIREYGPQVTASPDILK